MIEAVNVCEHGDHPAPPGKRFCSKACADCELVEHTEAVACAGLCLYSVPALLDTVRLRALCLRAHDVRGDSEAYALARAEIMVILNPAQLLALVDRWDDVDTYFGYVRRAFVR